MSETAALHSTQISNGSSDRGVNSVGNEMFDREDVNNDFWRLLRVLRRWWWLIALIVLLGGSLAWYQVSKQVRLYKASALIEVKQEERKIVDVSAVENVVVDKEFLVTQIELLKSRSLAEDTIEALNLINDPYLAPVKSEGWASLSRDQRLNIVVSRFSSNLTISSRGRSRLISATFVHSDPDKAALIVNVLTDNFISNGLSRKMNATNFAREFLEERLDVVRTSLDQAERDLVSYATNNNFYVVSSGDEDAESAPLDAVTLENLNVQLTEASVEAAVAEKRYEQSLTNDFTSDILGSDELSALNSRKIELDALYIEKLAVYKPAFPEMIELKARIDLIDEEIKAKTEKIKTSALDIYKNDFDLAKFKQQDLQQRVNKLKNSVVDYREKRIDYNILKRQVETERTQYEALLQRLKEVSVTDDLGSSLVEIVDVAEPPQSPFKPNKFRVLIIALFLSGLIGYAIAYILELIDDRVKVPDDLSDKLNQVVMGVIPLSKNQDNIEEELIDPQSTLSEAYASLRTNLQFSGANGGPRVIQVTSSRSGEGKSLTSFATALRYAGIDKKVLLVDGDMRLPTFSEDFTVGEVRRQPSVGLSGVLTQDVSFEDQIRPTKHKNLWLLPSGMSVPNPSEILSGERFHQFLTYARENFDYVIVDSPPVLGLADAPILGAQVDASIFVIEVGRLRTPEIRASIKRLKISGTKLLGGVLTKYKSQTRGYMNYYQYSYGSAAGRSDSARGGERKPVNAKKPKKKIAL